LCHLFADFGQQISKEGLPMRKFLIASALFISTPALASEAGLALTPEQEAFVAETVTFCKGGHIETRLATITEVSNLGKEIEALDETIRLRSLPKDQLDPKDREILQILDQTKVDLAGEMAAFTDLKMRCAKIVQQTSER